MSDEETPAAAPVAKPKKPAKGKTPAAAPVVDSDRKIAGHEDGQHPISGKPVKVPIYVPSIGFPVNKDVNQAPMAKKGDVIVEWVENAVNVKYIKGKDGRDLDQLSTNLHHVEPMLHTQVYTSDSCEDPMATAKKLAAKKPGAKIYVK